MPHLKYSQDQQHLINSKSPDNKLLIQQSHFSQLAKPIHKIEYKIKFTNIKQCDILTEAKYVTS